MKFTITLTEANRLEGLLAMVVKGKYLLRQVLLDFQATPSQAIPPYMSVVGTDSYRLAKQFLGIEVVTGTVPTEPVQLEATGLFEALKKVRTKTIQVELELFEDKLVFTNLLRDGSITTSHILSSANQFPARATDLLTDVNWDEDPGSETTVAQTMAALNPIFLAEMPRILGATTKPTIPVEIKIRGRMKPVGFRCSGNGGNGSYLPANEGLLMPTQG